MCTNIYAIQNPIVFFDYDDAYFAKRYSSMVWTIVKQIHVNAGSSTQDEAMEQVMIELVIGDG